MASACFVQTPVWRSGWDSWVSGRSPAGALRALLMGVFWPRPRPLPTHTLMGISLRHFRRMGIPRGALIESSSLLKMDILGITVAAFMWLWELGKYHKRNTTERFVGKQWPNYIFSPLALIAEQQRHSMRIAHWMSLNDAEENAMKDNQTFARSRQISSIFSTHTTALFARLRSMMSQIGTKKTWIFFFLIKCFVSSRWWCFPDVQSHKSSHG